MLIITVMAISCLYYTEYTWRFLSNTEDTGSVVTPVSTGPK
jgi:hypothetical protein